MFVLTSVKRLRHWPVLIVLAVWPATVCVAQKSSDDLLPIIKGLKYGYINRSGRIAVRPRFDHASIFSEGMGRIEMNGRYGFVDRTGRIAIKPRFNMAGNFAEGLAVVKIPDGMCELCGEWVYINKMGEIVIRTKPFAGGPSDHADEFSEGLARIYSGEGQPKFPNNLPYGYIDKSGRVVIQRKFGYAGAFHEGLAVVAKDYMSTAYGYINRQGEYVIKPQFSNAVDFQEGLAAVQIQGRWGYIDRTGRVIIGPQFVDAWPFSEGCAMVKVNDKYGYINRTGQFVVPAMFDAALPFSEGLAPAKRGSTRGYIDKQGKFVITFRSNVDDYEAFSGGIARVLVRYKANYPMKIGYIDRRGRFIWKPTV